MQGLRLKGAQGFVPIKPSIFIFSLYYPAEPATIVATPYPALRDLPKGKRLTWFSGRFAPLQHGYHRFTGVTQVRLPPLFRGQNFPSLFFHSHHMGAMPSAHSAPPLHFATSSPQSQNPCESISQGSFMYRRGDCLGGPGGVSGSPFHPAGSFSPYRGSKSSLFFSPGGWSGYPSGISYRCPGCGSSR